MNISINPKDTNTFATACLDRTVKVWSISNPTPNYSFDAHEKGGVNFVEYYHGNDKPYMITTGDDKTVKIWDYLSKSCIQTLEGHTSNVSFAVYHPTLPLIISGSEDGTVKLWHANTYRLENTLNYALERAWCVGLHRETNEIAVGYDNGVVVLKLGRDEPSYSMDTSGKLVYTRGSEVLTCTLQTAADAPDASPSDGARVSLPPRELGTTEVYASALVHSPNGRFVAVVGDGEYIVYTALAWRNKAFGPGSSFAWADDSSTYAVQEGRLKIRVFRNFRERKDGGGALKGVGAFALEGLHGGPLLGARAGGFVVFWDWETGEIVRRVDVEATNVCFWFPHGRTVRLC
jgi:coatomer subunit beta'